MKMENNSRKLKLVEEKMAGLVDFIDCYLPLATAHNTDFIFKEHWKKMIPETIARELLSLSDDQLQLLPSGQLYSSCQRSTTSTCDKSLVEEIDDSISESFSDISCSRELLCSHDLNDSANDTSIADKHVWIHKTLEEFLTSARENTLEKLNVLTDFESVRMKASSRNNISKEKEKEKSEFMSIKKSYEVNIMTDVCSSLAARFKIKKVIDIGSGLGYLGCHLSFNHGFDVLGIDSSNDLTNSAKIRTKRLKKQWLGLTKNRFLQSSKFVDGNEELDEKLERMMENAEYRLKSGSFQLLTQLVTSSTDLEYLIHQHLMTSEGDERRRILLTGLHTCGDLSSNIIELFLTTSSAQLLCQVGCCYNLMTEKFEDDASKQKKKKKSTFETSSSKCERINFPLSSMLKKHEFYFGFNARMLASQSTDRLSYHRKLPSVSFHWRSLLQLILFHRFGRTCDDWCVGKIASKSENFFDYVKRAFRKLQMNDDNISEDFVNEYESKYENYRRKNLCFNQLRTILSPCIESLLLLDRLAYLLEQRDVEEAHIVQIFDPIRSPRCFALVAVKHFTTDCQTSDAENPSPLQSNQDSIT